MQPFWMELKVRLLADLHTAGPGRSVPLVDRCVEVDARGEPFIPASSFRGRVRAHLERLLSALGHPVCQPPNPARMCPLEDGTFCLACQIFGNPSRQSAIHFSDLKPAQAVPELPVRVGIGINRDLQTVEAQRLFLLETVPVSDVEFVGTVEGWLLSDQLGWLIGAIGLITHLGGNKARGLGRVQVEITRLLYPSPNTEIDHRALLKEVLSP
ncbi:hypothetical protein HRbin15_01201 [bacterium HR15]|nr:hypothetical protein HRbin15_01201 [bacterium HR15]